MVTVERKTIKIKGLEVVYYTAGHGEPLVVVHGGAGDARTWFENMRMLAEKYTVYAPDLPGYGGSQAMDGRYYIPELTVFIEEFTRAVGLDKFYLVGHSLGGGIALNVALMFPEKIRKLVLISSLCLGREVGLWLRFLSIPTILKMLTKIFFGITRGIVWLAEQFNPARLVNGMSPAAVMVGTSITTWQSQTLILEKRLSEVKMPTLLVWGGLDPVVPVKQAYSAAEAIPDCQLRVFKNRGHNVHREALKQFSSILEHFLG